LVKEHSSEKPFMGLKIYKSPLGAFYLHSQIRSSAGSFEIVLLAQSLLEDIHKKCSMMSASHLFASQGPLKAVEREA
jgi:hypothetical protein